MGQHAYLHTYTRIIHNAHIYIYIYKYTCMSALIHIYIYILELTSQAMHAANSTDGQAHLGLTQTRSDRCVGDPPPTTTTTKWLVWHCFALPLALFPPKAPILGCFCLIVSSAAAKQKIALADLSQQILRFTCFFHEDVISTGWPGAHGANARGI